LGFESVTVVIVLRPMAYKVLDRLQTLPRTGSGTMHYAIVAVSSL